MIKELPFLMLDPSQNMPIFAKQLTFNHYNLAK